MGDLFLAFRGKGAGEGQSDFLYHFSPLAISQVTLIQNNQ